MSESNNVIQLQPTTRTQAFLLIGLEHGPKISRVVEKLIEFNKEELKELAEIIREAIELSKRES